MVKRNNLVEIGRVVLINYGPYTSKLAVVLDIVDGARALVDGPYARTGVPRHTIPLRNLSLTPQKIEIGRTSRPKRLIAAYDKAKVTETFGESNWAKRLAIAKKRRNHTDFDRFKLMILKKKRSQTIRKELSKGRKSSGKAAAASGGKKAAAGGKGAAK